MDRSLNDCLKSFISPCPGVLMSQLKMLIFLWRNRGLFCYCYEMKWSFLYILGAHWNVCVY